jgi:predicted nucleotidyltransferase
LPTTYRDLHDPEDQPEMSTATAEQVMADTVQAAQAILGSEIEAIFVLGSLAHGGFAPLVSDVDVAIVVGVTALGTAEQMARVQSIVVEKRSNPLSERLSVFWADWHTVRTGEGAHSRLGPVDRLDLLDSGRLLLGSDQREPSVRPSRQELVVMSADHILNKFTDAYLDGLRDTRALLADGPRATTKAILFPVRFIYTLRTGRIGLNEDSARWYAAEGLPGGALVLQALEWRNHGIADAEAASQMLGAELNGIHGECFARYAKDLEDLGEASRAAALAKRAASVQLAHPHAG